MIKDYTMWLEGYKDRITFFFYIDSSTVSPEYSTYRKYLPDVFYEAWQLYINKKPCLDRNRLDSGALFKGIEPNEHIV
jgi:hypothetical protein